MTRQKNLNGAIALALVGLLMVTAIQYTSADAGDSATVIIGEDEYDAECIDGGLCVIPDMPASDEDLELVTNDRYWHTWRWYDGDEMWFDVVEVWLDDLGCDDPPQGFCHFETLYSVHDTARFQVKCTWDDGEWTGFVRVDGGDDDCAHAASSEFDDTFPEMCVRYSQANGFGDNWGTGDSVYPC